MIQRKGKQADKPNFGDELIFFDDERFITVVNTFITGRLMFSTYIF